MGARQVGKSTLTTAVAQHDHPARILTLDDQATRAAALADPTGFVGGLDSAVVIDEVQRAPDLLLAIKETVDRDPRPGRFLLTGSANVLTNRRVKDALTGRMEIVLLWPLSQAEIHATTTNFVDALYAADPPQISDAPIGRAAFVELAAGGGYPEARRRQGRRRERWFGDYLNTTLDRDLRDVSDALKLDAVPRLLRLLATQAAGLLNYKAVADRLQLHPDTVKSYTQLLETVFLVRRLPAWRPGLGAREVHTPKLYLVDSGLLAHLLGAGSDRIAHDDQITGKVLENFVAMEIVKHADWSQTDTRDTPLPRWTRRDRPRPRKPLRRHRRDRGQSRRVDRRARLARPRQTPRPLPRALPRRRHHPHRPSDTPPRRPPLGRPDQRTLDIATERPASTDAESHRP